MLWIKTSTHTIERDMLYSYFMSKIYNHFNAFWSVKYTISSVFYVCEVQKKYLLILTYHVHSLPLPHSYHSIKVLSSTKKHLHVIEMRRGGGVL